MPRTRPTRPGSFVDLGTFELEGLKPRRARAYVPPRPANGAWRPALVLFDGQNVFEDEGSFSGGWHAHEAVDRLVAGKSLAPIVIGVDHGNEERIDELGPWRDQEKGGKLDRMLSLVIDHVLPAAGQQLELAFGPGVHTIGGSSMGGLAALYAHFTRPDVFGGCLAMSPSVWFARRKIVEFVASAPIPAPRSAVYVDAGALEVRGVLLATCHVLTQRLRARGWAETGPRRVMLRPDAKGTHSEIHWRRRLPKALRFLYPA
jgi:predicted alpha/beta superfamily hydrolase